MKLFVLNMNEFTSVSYDTKWTKGKRFVFWWCLIALSYQFYTISSEFYSYKTRVETVFDQQSNRLELPAVTICTPDWFSHTKSDLTRKYPHLNKTLSEIDSKNISVDEKKFLKEKAFAYYTFKDRQNGKFFSNSIKDSDIISCILLSPTLYHEKRGNNLPLSQCSGIVPVLESKPPDFGKCFTIFSQQNAIDNQKTRFQVTPTVETIINLFINMPFFEEGTLYAKGEQIVSYMFVHQGNTLPSFDEQDAILLEPGFKYDVAFWKTTKSLLPHPYNTNCTHYSNSLGSAGANSYEQCVRQCYREKLKINRGCIPIRPYLVNDKAFKSERRELCPSLDEWLFGQKLLYHCIKSCKSDCIQTEYHLKSSKWKNNFYITITMDKIRVSVTKGTSVGIRYKGIGDITYEYVPVIKFKQYVCQMALQIVIWLGLSVFSIFNVFERTTSKTKQSLSHDKIAPNVIPVVPANLSAGPKFASHSETPNVVPLVPVNLPAGSKFGSQSETPNPKLDYYNNFIAKVVEGYPTHKT